MVKILQKIRTLPRGHFSFVSIISLQTKSLGKSFKGASNLPAVKDNTINNRRNGENKSSKSNKKIQNETKITEKKHTNSLGKSFKGASNLALVKDNTIEGMGKTHLRV